MSKRRTIGLLAVAELLSMAVWFSASAVVTALAHEWSLTDAGKAWLTMSVQAGFVVGAFGLAMLNLAARVPSQRLFTAATWAAAATALIPLVAEAPAIALGFRDRELALTKLGYLGHMWELYARWAWIPAFLASSFALRGVGPAWAALAAFAIIAAGALGSLLAGAVADRLGRTAITIASLAISGTCSIVVGFLYGSPRPRCSPSAWCGGGAVVADSAQFSACISELCCPEHIGTALTIQIRMGFLLTLATIRMIPAIERWVGWNSAFAFLALGPAVGIWAMWALQRSPAARRLAGGRG